MARGYPEAAGLSEGAFRKRLAPLAAGLERLPARKRGGVAGRVPFVLVVGSALVPRAAAVPLMELRGKPAPGLVLGGEPAHLARIGVVRAQDGSQLVALT